MKAVQDFNYKVALASGLKHLQGGKLRQAEEQFHYLVSKFPRADGGYRGLARVQVELGDRPAALATLRDGAAVLAKAGDRVVAIDLLREATQLDPLDLTAHRRLAATLAVAGDIGGAADEYARFANAEIAAGDPERARLEASYALETFGEIPKLHDLARSLGLELRTVRKLAAEPEPELGPAAQAEPEPAAPAELVPQLAPEPAPQWPAEPTRDGAPQADPRLALAAALATPAAPEVAVPVDPLALEARAVELLAARDPDAGRVAVEAAAALRDSGRVHAASDLLLQLVAAGINVHEAERELISVAHALGRADIAEERARLLAQAMRLG